MLARRGEKRAKHEARGKQSVDESGLWPCLAFDVATQLGNFFATRRRAECGVSGEGGKGTAGMQGSAGQGQLSGSLDYKPH